jgi:hypothetical protein
MKKLILSMLMLVNGVSFASGDHNLSFQAKDVYEDVRISWIVSDDIVQTCNMATALTGSTAKYNHRILACAVLYKKSNTCVIYTAKKLNLAILGHEIRHCFEGAWHE